MAPKQKTAPTEPAWTFLTNHAHVLLLIAEDPEIRLRELAEQIGITLRAVQRIVADLEASAYLQRRRFGRRNRYQIDLELPLRHPVEAHRTVGALLSLVDYPRGRS
jgi:DNA-binding Lrp family transcriptional regulator